MIDTSQEFNAYKSGIYRDPMKDSITKEDIIAS
jgi:hypothetical protein